MRFFYKARYVWLTIALVCILTALVMKIYTSLAVLPVILGAIGIFFMGLFIPTLSFRHSFQMDESYRKRLASWNDISYRVKKSGEYVFYESNQGIIVFSYNEQNRSHIVEWSNQTANIMFATDTLVDKTLENMMGEKANEIGLKENFDIEFYGRCYHCLVTKHNVLYLSDITAEKELNLKYHNESLVMGILNLDNYDQSLLKLTNQLRLQEATAIAQIIEEWSQKYHIVAQSVKDDQYLLIMNRQQLEALTNDDFDIIDNINEHANRNDYFMYVTIGLAADKTLTSAELIKKADAVLQNAHEKGGNQVALYLDGKLEFKNTLLNTYENTSPTYVHLKAAELFNLINSISFKDTVYIMPHYLADTDAFGASVAAYKLVESLGRNAKIVLDINKCGETVKSIYADINSNHRNMRTIMIEPELVNNSINNRDILLIVDVSKENMVLSPQVLANAHNVGAKIAIIDHHRNEQINKNSYEYIYINPAGSSTVEMISEMLEYAPNLLEITPYEANILLAGVVVDTNNYTQHMSYRTYNALSMLQKWGANTATVQAFLRDNLEETKIKNLAIYNAIFIKNKFAITHTGVNVMNDELLSKIADGLSLIEQIEVAFCLGVTKRDNTFQISIKARSLGYINCETLMHQLFNGGGHANQAAASILLEVGDNDSTVEEKIKNTMEQINQALNELENKEETWVILTESYHNDNGSYVKGEKIQLNEKEALKLLANGTAIKDTIDNQKMIDEEINQEQINKLKLQKRVNMTEAIIRSHVVTLYVELENNGALKNRITARMLTQSLNNELRESREDCLTIEDSMLRGIDKLKGIGDYTITVKITRDLNVECPVEIKQLLKTENKII